MLVVAVVLTGSIVALIITASFQAFLMISQQSNASTRNQLEMMAAATVAAENPLVGAPNGESPAAGNPAIDGAGPGTAQTPGAPTPVGLEPGTGSSAQPTAPVSADEVTSVYGIRVHGSIAQDLRDLIDAAALDGIALSGWGWRDTATQIRLRKEHCGTTDYAIYRMRSSQCQPPTARPGSSQHERGLAIDFTYAGRSISTRRSPGFKWLDEHAAAYGFKNLASEPWHWSTTGR